MTIYSGFSHEKWWFSIAMLVYQRVNVESPILDDLDSKSETIPEATSKSPKISLLLDRHPQSLGVPPLQKNHHLRPTCDCEKKEELLFLFCKKIVCFWGTHGETSTSLISLVTSFRWHLVWLWHGVALWMVTTQISIFNLNILNILNSQIASNSHPSSSCTSKCCLISLVAEALEFESWVLPSGKLT